MTVSINFHAMKHSWSDRKLEVNTTLQSNRHSNGEYAVIKLETKERGVSTGEATLFMDMEQVADLRFQLDKLLENYTTKSKEVNIETESAKFF